MKSKKLLNDLYLYIIIGMIAVIDILLISYFHEKLNYDFPNFLLNDVIIVIIAGFLGKLLATKNALPLWWNNNKELFAARELLKLFILGFTIVIPNTLIYYYNQNASMAAPWLEFSSLIEPILISLRAGLQEEVLYRLFIFSSIVFSVNKITGSKRMSVIIGIVLSAFIFGISHSGFYMAFISGLILAYVYYTYGLFSAILIHFLADAIPFTFLFFMQT